MVLAFVADDQVERALRAAFEEEGVPLVTELRTGGALALARAAAAASPLAVGIGGDGLRIVVVLGAAPGRPYLEAATAEARRLGHAAARLTARRPVPFHL